MNTLGFDSSTAACSACLLRADGAAFETDPEAAARAAAPAHARELMPAVADVLERSGLAWAELDALAVGVGPGGFTGLRIGVATARALARALGLGLRPVSSLLALAAGIAAEAGAPPGGSAGPADAAGAPLVLPLIDARRGELFGALVRGGVTLWGPFAARPDELAARLERERLRPLCAGDGSVRWRSVLEAVGVRVAPDGSSAHAVRGLHVCRLAAGVRPVPPEAVLPEYLRPPDAKPIAT